VNGTVLSRDLWLAELVARTWLEPHLAERYRADAHGVLAEFGITLGIGEEPPALPGQPASGLRVDNLSGPASANRAGQCAGCVICGVDEAPQPERLPEAQLVLA
jgi:putative thiazole/oxazole-modified microcin (TOMM)-like peptide